MTNIEKAKAHNESINHFITVTLKEHFGTDRISMDQWFEAQKLIEEQDFYNKGKAILTALRAEGYDAKIDMQSNKLHLPECDIWSY